MSTWYVDSTATGSGTGTSWTNAFTTLGAAISAAAAGDDFNIYSGSAESHASNVTLTFPGTDAAPNRVFSCDKTNAPAQASDLVAGAQIITTGATNITIGGGSSNGYVYIYGVSFQCGTGSSASSDFVMTNQSEITLDTCTIAINNTSISSGVSLGNTSVFSNPSKINWINTTVKFSNSGQSISVGDNCDFTWRDTPSGAVAGSTAPTTLIAGASVITLEGLDLSLLISGSTILGSTHGLIRNCKLGSSVVVATAATPMAQTDLIISDSSGTGYRQERYRYQGTLTASTTVYNAASDGVTPISWQVVTTANSNRQSPFACFEIAQWLAAGTYGATVSQITSGTAGLTSADVWIEARYMGNSGSPLDSLVTSAPATLLTAGSALIGGSWAAGALAHVYELQVPSFITAIAGYVYFTIKVAKPSLTVYVDPLITVA